MRAFWIALAALCCAAVLPANGDETIASMQQALKGQGFYYGEITGTKDADTTAAIRRYQIRNGLKITGDLNEETQKSLGLRGNTPAKSAPVPQPQRRGPSAPPAPQTAQPPADDTSDLREDQSTAPAVPRAPPAPPLAPIPPQSAYPPQPGAAPGRYPGTNGVLDGTPYQLAPVQVQRQVIMSAQLRLSRKGYYRSTIDGAYGSDTAFALRAFQSRFGLQPTGRLDVQTLGALGLLPGQRAPGMEPPRGRIYRPQPVGPALGARVYHPAGTIG